MSDKAVVITLLTRPLHSYIHDLYSCGASGRWIGRGTLLTRSIVARVGFLLALQTEWLAQCSHEMNHAFRSACRRYVAYLRGVTKGMGRTARECSNEYFIKVAMLCYADYSPGQASRVRYLCRIDHKATCVQTIKRAQLSKSSHVHSFTFHSSPNQLRIFIRSHGKAHRPSKSLRCPKSHNAFLNHRCLGPRRGVGIQGVLALRSYCFPPMPSSHILEPRGKKSCSEILSTWGN